jgi:hypothetical protein
MSDLYCIQGGAPLRLEMMWRAKANTVQLGVWIW